MLSNISVPFIVLLYQDLFKATSITTCHDKSFKCDGRYSKSSEINKEIENTMDIWTVHSFQYTITD